jgi:BON domain
MTDDDLRRDVAAELYWDPQVGSPAIEVSAASGMVTLRGTVASLRHKRAGGSAAARVRGSPGSPMNSGCRFRTGTGATTRTCAATYWKR